MSADDRAGAALAKLSAARARMVLERPFLGALIIYLRLVSRERCTAVATDGRAIYFNAGYVLSLSFAETQFMLAHLALHCALGHFARRGHRLRDRWDAACDYAVDAVLVADGMKPPAGALWNAAYEGLAAEEIYPLLPEPLPARNSDEHWFGTRCGLGEDDLSDRRSGDPSADEAPSAGSRHNGIDETGFDLPAPGEVRELLQRWQARLGTAALEFARRSGGGCLPDLIDELAQPRLPWRALLSRFLMGNAREDYSFARRSRREGDALLPGMEGGEANLVVAIDVSGSIGREEMHQFVDELNALKGEVRANVALLFCDWALSIDSPRRFSSWEPIELPEALPGGGGTRFTPVFEWVEEDVRRPDALLYFTDAQGEFPAAAPAYPVLWLVKGNAAVPFGERVQLN